MTGYDRIARVGPPTREALERTTIVRCSIRSISCKQRSGGFDNGKEPILQSDIQVVSKTPTQRQALGQGQGQIETEGEEAFKGVIPCWTVWGKPLGFGRDREEVERVFKKRTEDNTRCADAVAWASDGARIEGLGLRRKKVGSGKRWFW